VLSVKSVKQNYMPTEPVLTILVAFRQMVNDCIRIGLEQNTTSMKSLSLKSYDVLSSYDVATCYRLTALSKAAGLLRNYRKALRKHHKTKKPHIKRLLLTDCYLFKIMDDKLRLTIRAHKYEYITLNAHTLKILRNPAHAIRSVSLTDSTLSIAFSKETVEAEPVGAMGIDRNLDNVTLAASNGEIKRYDLSEATRIKSSYRAVKSCLKRNDVRLRKRVFRKYGIRQRNRINQILHQVSKDVVAKAKAESLGIVMEDIRGLRKLYQRGNGQGKDYRARMNSWSYAELQRQIEYKARWEGLPVIYVSARGTSATCSTCGSKTYPNGQRTLFCPKCGISMNRDENAAKNILERGLRFGPFALPIEAMVEERSKPILKVDGSELIRRDKNDPKT
jgi:putative transposase